MHYILIIPKNPPFWPILGPSWSKAWFPLKDTFVATEIETIAKIIPRQYFHIAR